MTTVRAVRAVLIIVCAISIFALTGCKEKMPPYENIVQAIDNYHVKYSDYLNSGASDIIQNNNDNAVTKDGKACRSYYVKSPDGSYESVTLEVEQEGTLSVDEDFRLSDKAFYIVRSYIEPDTMTPSITTYYVWYGSIYMIDEEKKALVEADEQTAAGFYLSFGDLITQYGGSAAG